MLRKILLIAVASFILILGVLWLWPKNTDKTINPLPTISSTPSSAFSPSFKPSATPSIPSQKIDVSIISVPQGAKISINNTVVGTAPLRFSFQTQTQYHIDAQKEGFVPLAVDFSPTTDSLRLTLVPLNSIATFTPIAQSLSPTPTIPQASPVDFPTPFSLSNNTLPVQQYIYSPSPTNTSSSQATSGPSPVANTVVPTPFTSNKSTYLPSEQEIAQAENIINKYTGVEATDPNDAVQQGTAGEHVIVISDRYFYPSPITVFVAFKPHFVNTTNSVCTLKATTDHNTVLTIGTLAPQQDLIFTPSDNLNGTWQFSCQERPAVNAIIQFFS